MECDPLTNSSNRCRVCLDHTENTVCLLDVSNTKREAVSYLEILNTICKLESENGTQEICRDCAQVAEISYDFKILCEQSDKVLKDENQFCLSSETKVISELVRTSHEMDEYHDDYFDTDDVQDEMIDVKDVNIDLITQDSFDDVKPYEEDTQNPIKINSDKNNFEEEYQNERTVESCNMNDLNTHKVNYVELKEIKTTIPGNTCPICKRSYSRKSYMRKHMLKCTNIDSSENVKINEENINCVRIIDTDTEKNEGATCPLCKKTFNRKRYLKQHLPICSRKHSFEKLDKSCENCNEIFPERTSYEMHISSKNCSPRKYPETCQFCDYKPTSSSDYHKHSKSEHLQKKKFCVYCDYTFIHTDDYNKHLVSEHPDKKICCKHCDYLLYTVRTYSQHMKNKHPNEKLDCHLCNLTTEMSGILYKHYQDDHSDHFYTRQCKICDFKTICMLTLGKHMEVSHAAKKTVQCEKCEKKFFTIHQLQVHVKSQHGEPQSTIICEVCGKYLKNQANLRTHMLIHEGGGKFQCKHCPKTFHTSSCLYSHNISHRNEFTYKCNDCEKFFKTNTYLNRHIRREHLKIKPISCNDCGGKFESKSQMMLHAVIHTGIKKYECMECGKMFAAKRNLVQHSVVHTGERKHVCEVCGKGFTQAHVLRSHLKIHNV